MQGDTRHFHVRTLEHIKALAEVASLYEISGVRVTAIDYKGNATSAASVLGLMSLHYDQPISVTSQDVTFFDYFEDLKVI